MKQIFSPRLLTAALLLVLTGTSGCFRDSTADAGGGFVPRTQSVTNTTTTADPCECVDGVCPPCARPTPPDPDPAPTPDAEPKLTPTPDDGGGDPLPLP